METHRRRGTGLAASEGQKFLAKQCAIYFGFEEGDLAQTAFVPAPEDKKE
jgi:hypothetical protein